MIIGKNSFLYLQNLRQKVGLHHEYKKLLINENKEIKKKIVYMMKF